MSSPSLSPEQEAELEAELKRIIRAANDLVAAQARVSEAQRAMDSTAYGRAVVARMQAEKRFSDALRDPAALLASLRVARADTERMLDAMEDAWGVIANAAGGNWGNESADWQAAARHWADNYNGMLGKLLQKRAISAAIPPHETETPTARGRVKVTRIARPQDHCWECKTPGVEVSESVTTRKGEGVYADTPLVTLPQRFMRCATCGREWMTEQQHTSFETQVSAHTFHEYRRIVARTQRSLSSLQEAAREHAALVEHFLDECSGEADSVLACAYHEYKGALANAAAKLRATLSETPTVEVTS